MHFPKPSCSRGCSRREWKKLQSLETMQSEFLKWGVGKVKKGHGIMFPTLSRNTLIFQVSEAHAEAMFAFAVILCRHLTTNFIACLLNYRHPNTVCRIAWDTRTWILCVFSQVLNGCLWKKRAMSPGGRIVMLGAGESAQQVQELAAKPANLNSAPWNGMVEGEKWLPNTVLWPPHTPPRMRSQLNKQMTAIKFLWFDP